MQLGARNCAHKHPIMQLGARNCAHTGHFPSFATLHRRS